MSKKQNQEQDQTPTQIPIQDEESLPLYQIEQELREALQQWQDAKDALEAAQTEKDTTPPKELAELQNAEALFHSVVQLYMNGAARKRDSIAHFVSNLEGRAAHLGSEIAKLQAAKRRAERKAEALKHYVQYVMMGAGKLKLEGETWQFSLRRNPASVEILDPAKVPDSFLHPPKPCEPDKRGLVTYLTAIAKQKAPSGTPPEKLGPYAEGSVPGVQLKTDKYSLVIK